MASARSPISRTSPRRGSPRRSGQDLGADRGRVFGARVVVGDDQQFGPGGRGGAHQRALGPVAVPAGAEHDQQPARDLRTQGVEQRGDGGGLVGVVDDREERLPALDPLHPAGDGDPGEALGRHRRRHPGRVQAGEGDERVRDVERARAGAVAPARGRAGSWRRSAACRRRRPRPRRRASRRAPPVGDGRRARGPGGQPDAPLVVDADHRALGAAGREQRGLRREVVVHVGVEVEVVLRQVGEGADGEAGAGDPAERERVAGHLHRHVRDALLQHHREQRLQVGSLGSGERAGQRRAGDPDADGADQPGDASGLGQPRLEQVRHGGLAAGPGDAEHAQPLRRVAVDGRGGRPEHRAGLRVHQHGQPRGGGAPAARRGR